MTLHHDKTRLLEFGRHAAANRRARGEGKPESFHFLQPEIRTAIEAAGAHLRFLPPYSPDFNPIEQAFAKLRAFPRAARPRSLDQVCELIASALGLFTPAECANYVRHSGYRVATSL